MKVGLTIVGLFLIVGGVDAWLLLHAICVVDSNPTARVMRGDLDAEQLRSLQLTPWREPSAEIRPFVSWLESFEKGKIIRCRQASWTDHLLIRQTYYEAEYLMPDGKTIIGPALGPMPYAAPNSRVLFAVIAIAIAVLVLAVVRGRKTHASEGRPNVARETSTPVEHEQIARTQHGGHEFWYVPDIIVIALLFGCITFAHSSYLIWYVGGLHNRAPFMFDPYIWYVLLATLVGAICLVILLIRIFGTWPKHIHRRGRLWGLGLSAVLSLVVYGSLHFVPIPREYNDPFLLGYRKYTRAKVDVPAIRAWLSSQDPNSYRGVRIDLYALTDEQKASLPQAITNLRPDQLDFFLDAHNDWGVTLGWGHVNDSWGVDIGKPDMELPLRQLKDEAGRSLSYPVYRLALAPGAYVWHRPH